LRNQIIDLGSTPTFGEVEESDTFTGAEDCQAPEIKTGGTYNPQRADVWSLGAVGYALHFGETCNMCPQYMQKIANIQEINLRELLQNTLHDDPKSRWDTDKMLDSAWLKEAEGDDILWLEKANNRQAAWNLWEEMEENHVSSSVTASSGTLVH